MRMPILPYFVVVGATLLTLLTLSSYALPDVGPPIKTSQLVGLPKVEPRPEPEPSMATFNFGVPRESIDTPLPNTIYAKDTSSFKGQSVHLAKRRQTARKDKAAPRERRVAVYSHDVMMSIH